MSFAKKYFHLSLEMHLERLIKVIVPFVLLLPFVISSDFYFPYITPRNFAFRILVSIALAAYLFLFFRNKEKYKLPLNKTLLSYIAFALVMTVSSFINGDFLYSFWSNAERMEGLLNIYYLIAFLIVILGTYRHKKAWLGLLRFSVWSSLLMVGIALAQHWGIDLLVDSAGDARISGAMGNPTYLAGYALFNLFFVLYLFFKGKQRPLKWELWSFYALDVLLIFFEIKSSSAGALSIIIKNSSLLVLFLVLQILVNLQYYFYNRIKRVSKASFYSYFFLAGILNFLALFYTQTRGILVGLLAAAIVVAIFLLLSKYTAKKIKYVVLAGLIAVVVFTSSIFVFKDSNFIKSNPTLQRVSIISLSDATTETRLLTWKLSLKAFADKPILGWGEDKFLTVFNKYFPTEIYKNSRSRVWFDRPHNVFLQQLVHGGALGLLAYLTIFAFAIKNLWNHYRRTHDVTTISVFGGLIIAYLVQNFFVFDSINTYLGMVITLAVTIFVGHSVKSKEQKQKANWISPVVACLIVLVLGYMLNIPQARANYLFIKNYKANAAMGYDEKLNSETIKVINSHYLGKFEFRQVYTEYAQGLLQTPNAPIGIQEKVLADAEAELIKTINEQPDNVRNHSFLISLYMIAVNMDLSYAQSAIDLIENKAIPLSPTRTSLYYSLGRLYMNIGNFDKANENFHKARDLSPYVFESYMNLFLNYYSVGDVERAEKMLEDMEENVPVIEQDHYVKLAGIYQFFSEEQKAIDMLLKGADIYPKDLNILGQLTYMYDQAGQAEQAQIYLDRVIQISPAFGEELRRSIGL